jgi:uncharacterized repeat protein (TIGR01451 family)
MKNAFIPLAASSVGVAVLSLSAPVYAAGVPAGTLIENTAEASYSLGGISQTVPSNTVTVTVDEILDVAVSSLDGGTVALNSTGAVLTFEVNNTGNGPEAYEITVDPAIAGDDFDPVVTAIAYDSNGNDQYDAGVDTLLPAGTATPDIVADGSLRIFVILAFDAPPPGDADLADIRLTATAVTGSGTPGTVFAGQGVGGSDAVVGVTTAQADDLGTVIAQVSSVSLSKSATVLDPFGGSEAIPGAVVTYSLVASVSGSSAVDSLVVTDPIPASTTYEAGSLQLDTAPLTDADDGDAGDVVAGMLTVDLGTVAGGASHTITFQVKIDE